MKRMSRAREAQLRQLLVDRKLRVTTQRLEVLRALTAQRHAVSHPELTAAMENTTLDRATIYRTLLALVEAGILIRSQLGDTVWRYELPGNQTRGHRTHAHFICDGCGDVTCLPDDAVKVNGLPNVTEIHVRGSCKSCLAA